MLNPTCTKKQILYIEQLAIDLIMNREDRNENISKILHREIKFLDQLTPAEASLVINQFKQWKEDLK